MGALRDNDVKTLRDLCKNDLFFLLTVGLGRKDANEDWLYDRCREVQDEPDGRLDLWAREHYKSTIITFALTIQDVLNDPDITVGIFSHTKSIARGFVTQIKSELEGNSFLKGLFPDVLYENPERESPRWSIDRGIVVKRKSNPKEATVTGWGLVDGQPTSAHYRLLVYDDVVTKESVSTPEMIANVTASWELSLNLGARGGKKRYIGTRYHFNDTYRTIMDRKAAVPRIYAATKDGQVGGDPIFLTRDQLDEKRREMGPYTFGSQMLQNPIADAVQGFKKEWLRFVERERVQAGLDWNIYITVDPASGKKKENDYTVMWVHGLSPDGNYYLMDAIRDRLNLTERTSKLFELVRKWRPIRVGYEKYGMQCDIEHIQEVMERENYRFEIIGCAGPSKKEDRIRRMVPTFEQGKYYFPHQLLYLTCDGKVKDFVADLLAEEYEAFPVAIHDDMLDCMCRIKDKELNAVFPAAGGGARVSGHKKRNKQKKEFQVFQNLARRKVS